MQCLQDVKKLFRVTRRDN